MSKIKSLIESSLNTKENMLKDSAFIETIDRVVDEIINAYRRGNKVLAAGNGGSAADAQHFIAEFVGRFYYDRPAMAGVAITTDSSILTAIGNDYGYEYIFSRQVEANAVKGDILLVISTSGNSLNIVNAIMQAKKMGVVTVGLTGSKLSKMEELCDFIIKIPSFDTPRIQEGQLLVEHIICQLVEEAIYPKKI